jgi:hypothetical protein
MSAVIVIVVAVAVVALRVVAVAMAVSGRSLIWGFRFTLKGWG